MLKRAATFVEPMIGSKKQSLDERISELRARTPVDLNHGQALMLQGIASSSLREQRIIGDKIELD